MFQASDMLLAIVLGLSEREREKERLAVARLKKTSTLIAFICTRTQLKRKYFC